MDMLTGMATNQFSDSATSNDTMAELVGDCGFSGHSVVTSSNANYVPATIVNISNISINTTDEVLTILSVYFSERK